MRRALTVLLLAALLAACGNKPRQPDWLVNADSAQERYQLVGAQPNTTYTVALNIFSDSTCTTLTRTVPTETFTTNGAGNGEAAHTFFQTGPWPPPTPPTLRTVYIQWVFSSGGVPQYETGCVPVVLGG